MGHEGKCRNLHGHQYAVLLEARGLDESLDTLGRVIDFSVLKAEVGAWIEQEWDHGFLLYDQDREAIGACDRVEGQKMFLLPANPTAENIAEHLLRVVCPMLLDRRGVQVRKVTVWETPNCFATAEL